MVLRYQSIDEVKGIFNCLLSMISEIVINDQSHETLTSNFFSSIDLHNLSRLFGVAATPPAAICISFIILF